ncbi:nuclear transport factor 2 family protein [Promicromonospora sp. NPDC090134]|uniref:nuclear transport factor 2 family protein n=1 Tax=Promicromonospora sp. NPDC090134 TaxID=3364408 RepID=UPI0038191B3F
MSAREVMERLADVIDGHRWDELPGLLDPAFTCTYVHTGETYGADAWVRLNAEYPGFQNLRLEDCVADGERAAGRAHVTGMSDGVVQHFEVATFITARDGVIVKMTEVWTDVDQVAPEGTRPS